MSGTNGPPASACDSSHTATTETRLQFVDPSDTFPPINHDHHEIRLLHIRRCSTKQSIVCELSVVSLDDVPKYDALSYVWGTTDDPAMITVNGLGFRITRNLHTILINMIPHDNSTRPLWIDAICINQGSEPEYLEERRHQVNLMKKTYSNAVSVTAYLGDPFQGLNLAMKFLSLAAKEPARHINLDCFPHLIVSAKAARRSGELPRALYRLFNLPWWDRVWTVQEYVLGREVVFQTGHLRYPADVVFNGVQSFVQHEQRYPYCECDAFANSGLTLWAGVYSLESMNSIRRSDVQTLSRGLTVFHDRRCNDPRDKIYAMLSLFTGFENAIEPDYTKTTEDLFQEVALAWAQKERNLDFLSHVAKPHKRPGLPTWAVDWSLWPYPSLGMSLIIKTRINMQTLFFDASLGSDPSWELKSPGEVTANGFLFDSIAVDPMKLGWEPDVKVLSNLSRVCKLDPVTYAMYGSPMNVQEALLRTVCGDVMFVDNNWIRYREEHFVETFLRVRHWGRGGRDSMVEDSSPNETGPCRELSFSAGRASAGRSFVSTCRGYIGFTNQETRLGDLVAILGGGKVPIILRPTSTIPKGQSPFRMTDELSFQVVGDAYIQGIMDGEAVEICGKNKDDLGQLTLV